MDVIITLLADPKKTPLDAAFVQSMALSLASQGVSVVRTQWREAQLACDVHVAAPFDKAQAAARNIVADQPYDAIVRPANAPRLLISDMDSTMITVECIDELADFVGKKSEVAAITDRAMNGELDFEAALAARVALLAGLPQAALQECYDARVKIMPGAHALLRAAREKQIHCVLVSGGFTFFTSRVRAELGFAEDYSNQLEMEHGALTGRVIAPVLGKEAKLATLKRQCAALNITPAQALAIGDGANDLPMLLAAGLGVAYHAKPVVRAQAGAQLNHCDLSALMYLL